MKIDKLKPSERIMSIAAWYIDMVGRTLHSNRIRGIACALYDRIAANYISDDMCAAGLGSRMISFTEIHHH